MLNGCPIKCSLGRSEAFYWTSKRLLGGCWTSIRVRSGHYSLSCCPLDSLTVHWHFTQLSKSSFCSKNFVFEILSSNPSNMEARLPPQIYNIQQLIPVQLPLTSIFLQIFKEISILCKLQVKGLKCCMVQLPTLWSQLIIKYILFLQ